MLTPSDVAGADDTPHGYLEEEAHLHFVELGIPPHYTNQWQSREIAPTFSLKPSWTKECEILELDSCL